MAVASNTGSESHAGATGSASEASFSWSHAGAASGVKGVLVWVLTNADAADVTSVTYGGVNVPAVTGGEAIDMALEPGRCNAFFLGSGVPQGTQTVVVNRVNNADVMYAIAETVTADADTAVHEAGIVLLQGDGTLAEQSVTDGSPGTNSLRFAAVNSGLPIAPSAGANSATGVGRNIDFGARVAAAAVELVAGQGARLVGFLDGASDDRAAVHLAIKEVNIGPLYEGTPGDLGFEFGMGALSGEYAVGGGERMLRGVGI